MKSKIKIVLLTVLACLLLSSCATSLRVAYQSPSDIDMGQYRNIAIASTVPFKGFQSPGVLVKPLDVTAMQNARIFSTYSSDLVYDVAEYATNYIQKELGDTRFFTIVPPSITDAYISTAYIGVDTQAQLQKNGIEAVIIPKIISMTANEYVASEKYFEPDMSKPPVNGAYTQVEKIRYIMTQAADIVYSYTIIDVATMTVYDTRTFSNSREVVSTIDKYGFGYTYDMDELFYDMMAEIIPNIKTQLVPTTRASYFDLMKNKPKNAQAEQALKDVDNGNLALARDLYLSIWNTDRHIPSGYNAAIIYASLGNLDAAISLLQEMTTYTNDSTVASTLRQLQSIYVKNTDAKKQASGERVNQSDSETNINIFQVVIGN